MVETNVAILRRLYENVWNGENPDMADEVVHDQYHIHDRELTEQMQGPKLYKALATGTREIFPDMVFTIEDVIAASEKVALRWTMTGTHKGPGFGVDPTGKQVEMRAIEINRFEEGKLIETWTQSNQLDLMEQVGAVSASE